MTIKIIQNETQFDQMKVEWNSLLSLSASHVPFLRHEYLTSWWRNLGGEEWKSGELAILIQNDDNEGLTGIAPFFLNGENILLLGSHEISDYLDLITPEENLENFTSEIMSYLSSEQAPHWKRMDLYNLPDRTPSLQSIKNAAVKAGFKVSQDVLQPAPSIALPSSWEEYLDSLEGRYRSEIHRKDRNAETYFLPVDWYIVTDHNQIENEMDAFLDLMADNPEKAQFLTDPMRKQLKETALAADREDWLQLAFLTVGGVKAAGYLNFDFQNVIWVYNSGINSTFENISPGWVLLSRLIEWAINQGRSTFDFMRGDETYKYQFGGVDQQVVRMTVQNN